jgi:AraC-like DNA-binding protein
MNYKILAPPMHLKGLVQCFWALESNQNETTPNDYFLMADSCPEIIFQYNEGFKTYSAQSARMRFQHSIYDRFDVGKKVGFFGVRLYPHAVTQLLKIPANEVVNHVFDFSDLFKQDGADLADRVYNSANAHERAARVADFLAKKVVSAKIDPIQYFVDRVVEHAGGLDVSSMQKESGLSVSQFERRFKAIAGFPPKYFARIVRFQGVKDKYCSKRCKTLTSLAYSCDYYDQSHFNREFKEFSGVQPLRYFKFIDQQNTDLLKPGNDFAGVGEQRRFGGYLPCGWFV